MAKDAKGHGSDARGAAASNSASVSRPGSYTGAFKGGGSIGAMMENAPKSDPETGELGSAHSANSGEAHVASIAAQHGVSTDHLSNFPITLIGDKGHADAQKATVARLTAGAQRARDNAFLAKTPNNSREAAARVIGKMSAAGAARRSK